MLDFLSGALVTALANTAALGGIGTSLAEKAIHFFEGEKVKDAAALETLFKGVYFGVAFDTLRERVSRYSGWDAFVLALQKSKIEAEVIGLDTARYFSTPAHDRKKWLCSRYSELFCALKALTAEKVSFSRDDLDAAFEDIVSEAYQSWTDKLRRLRKEYPVFADWLDDNQMKSLSAQMSGKLIPDVRGGADQHLLQKAVVGKYWAQSIRFHDGQTISARPGINAAGAGLSAEALNIQREWWSDFAERLSCAPLFLVGPGGMGKSAFLVYLYQTILKQQPECPFEKVFLLSLDSLISDNCAVPDYAGVPLEDPTQSLLLRRIAARAGDNTNCVGWKEAMTTGSQLYTGRPVLLLLDGLNEMKASQEVRGNVYSQIIKEIAALANKDNYPYVRLVITSRAESAGEWQAQLNDLHTAESSFQIGVLDGISEYTAEDIQLSAEMLELLKRPLYYKYFKDYDDPAALPSNQYEALQIMYKALSAQSEDNAPTAEQRRFRQCVFACLLPIIAYHTWANRDLGNETFERCCEEFVDRCSRQLIGRKFALMGNERILELARWVCKDAGSFLRDQEQILLFHEGKYIFRHQDYRDYLVAEYFCQRLDYLRDSLRDKCWDSMHMNLRLNTYGKSILRLIYQAVSFQTDYVDFFLIDGQMLDDDDITAGRLLWYTTAYQLSDLRKLAGIAYDETVLRKDTLAVLDPLTAHACYVASLDEEESVLTELPAEQKNYLIEILMKSCELYRLEGEFEMARSITRAAKHLCYPVTKSRMHKVIDHNIALIDLYDFMAGKTDLSLTAPLKLLRDCTAATRRIPPYRYSCNLLAQLLISPQPYLAGHPDYRQFVETEFGRDEVPVLFAFWAYYRAIFVGGKPDEDWLPRLYSLRQFLFLLAENKVEVERYDPSKTDIHLLEVGKARGKFSVRIPDAPTPIPSENNLRLMDSFLKKIAGFDVPWQHYLNGLVSCLLSGDETTARAQFTRAAQASSFKDTKAGLWLSYLDRDAERLGEVHKAGRERADANPNLTINAYNASAYYDRDVTSLYEQLKRQLQEKTR